MKKKLVFAALAFSATLFCACDSSSSSSPDVEFSSSGTTPIGFDQSSSAMSSGAMSSGALLSSSSMDASFAASSSSSDGSVLNNSSSSGSALPAANLVPDENGFVDIQAVYRSLQPNEKAVFAVRHGERDIFVTKESELTEDGVLQAQMVGRKLVGEDEFHYTFSDYVRTEATCRNIAIGRGQASFPFDSSDIYTGSWFVSNQLLFEEYAKSPSSSNMVVSEWSYLGLHADAFYDFTARNEEMLNFFIGDYAAAPRVKMVCSHDDFLVPIIVYVTNKAANVRVYENGNWLNYVAGVAVIQNDAGQRRYYAIKGLDSGIK